MTHQYFIKKLTRQKPFCCCLTSPASGSKSCTWTHHEGSQLAHKFCVCVRGNNCLYQQVAVVYIYHSKSGLDALNQPKSHWRGPTNADDVENTAKTDVQRQPDFDRWPSVRCSHISNISVKFHWLKKKSLQSTAQKNKSNIWAFCWSLWHVCTTDFNKKICPDSYLNYYISPAKFHWTTISLTATF